MFRRTIRFRSERRPCEAVHLNLSYRWFCRLDLNDTVPDHSTFSKNRHGRFRGSDIFRHIFEAVAHRCIIRRSGWRGTFAVDASLVEADVNVHHATERTEWDPTTIGPDEAPRAVRELLHADPAAQWAGTKRRGDLCLFDQLEQFPTKPNQPAPPPKHLTWSRSCGWLGGGAGWWWLHRVDNALTKPGQVTAVAFLPEVSGRQACSGNHPASDGWDPVARSGLCNH